jgi:peptide/nickel transport system ATP-binding protein
VSRPTPAVPAGAAAAGAGPAAALLRARRTLPKLADADAPLLVVEDLRTYFKLEGATVKAVDGISFRLDDGESLGIVGESGCGKTTAALSLIRLLPSNAWVAGGSVRLYGIDLMTKTEESIRRYRWREISLVFQGAMNALNPVQRIEDQIAEPIVERLGQEHDRAVARAGDLLELVGIPRARGRAYPHQLSGGMRQRAIIAMALACDPAIVIGDEPTTALDVMVQAQILSLLERLRRELGLSLILITHDLSVVAETCDRVLVMYAGRVAEEGPVERVFAAPRHPYTRLLMGAFPDIASGRRTLEVIPGTPPDLRNPPPGCRFAPRCPAAMDICRETVPPEVSFGDGIRVACHLHPAGSPGSLPATAGAVAPAQSAVTAAPAEATAAAANSTTERAAPSPRAAPPPGAS